MHFSLTLFKQRCGKNVKRTRGISEAAVGGRDELRSPVVPFGDRDAVQISPLLFHAILKYAFIFFFPLSLGTRRKGFRMLPLDLFLCVFLTYSLWLASDWCWNKDVWTARFSQHAPSSECKTRAWNESCLHEYVPAVLLLQCCEGVLESLPFPSTIIRFLFVTFLLLPHSSTKVLIPFFFFTLFPLLSSDLFLLFSFPNTQPLSLPFPFSSLTLSFLLFLSSE